MIGRRIWCSGRVALLIGSAMLLMACAPQQPGKGGALSEAAVAARVASAHLHRHLTQSPSTIDPSLNEDVAGYAVDDDLFEGLVRLDAVGNIVPGVAERWESSPDALIWHFHLRTSAMWSNGEPVTAADFVYAWRRVVNPATASAAAQQLAPIVGALDIAKGLHAVESLGVTATDAHTLEVRLASPAPYFLYLLTNSWLMPLHAATVEKFGSAWTQPEHIVGNGAFVLKSRAITGPIELARNPHYWDAASVRLQAVTFIPLPDNAAATARFLAGDLDLTDSFQVDDVQWLRASVGEQLRLTTRFGTVMLAMQVQRPPFDNAQLRQAMVLAIDRDVLTAKLLKGLYLPAWTIVPPLPDYPQVKPAWASMQSDARHALAQQLYARAGYSAAKPLDVELWYPTTTPDTRRVLEAMAAMWRMNLGANVRLANEEWSVHQQNRHIGKHQLFFYPWDGDYPDPLTFLGLPLATSDQNYMRYNSPRYAAAVDAAMHATDAAERNAQYNAAERILDEDAVVVPIYYRQSKHLLRSYVQGWQDNPMDRHLSRDLYLAQAAASSSP